jgi:7-carboxy-7-deazaguanine synthase
MTYAVKEMYHTLQGEGVHVGHAAVFCRFAGCNLWSGREEDRAEAVCNFCDTDFVGTDGENGGKFKFATDLAKKVRAVWDEHTATPITHQDGQKRFHPLVVCTGGEPLLQLDEQLTRAFHNYGFTVAVETNGTQYADGRGIDWICVSPKSDAMLRQVFGNELKLVYPQYNALPERFENLHFDNFFLQPMDGPDVEKNTQAAIEYCMRHPQWRLSLQTHKLVGIK